MLGIYGEAGIGKTTLVSYLYNKIRHQFEVASFLTNIREKSNNNNIIDLKDLQRTLLYETVKETQTVVETTFEGHSQIKDKLRHKRVLLILDDVNSIEQLKALAGGCDWFGSGSRIIITTRVETELDNHHVTIRKYKMEELNSCESLELFCWHAFNMSKPFDNYANICNDVVSYSKGFPRALKALGSNLKGLSVREWEMELEKYSNVPNSFSFLVDSL
jgi:GTPase SAR1 family protein